MRTIVISTSVAAALIIVTIVAYSNSFHNSFHFDDSHTIVNNIFIRTIKNIPLFFQDGTTFSSLPSNQSYRPLVTTSLAIDYWFGKNSNDTFYFHLSMFILFIVQGILMFFFYQTIFITAGRLKGYIFAAIGAVGWYILHPANAETINYIISRSDSYSALCIVLSFVLYVYSPFSKRWLLYLVPLALGMLTKPITSIFPLLLITYIFFFEQQSSIMSVVSRQGLNNLRIAFVKSLPTIFFIVGMLIFIKKMEPATWSPGGSSLFQYVITQPYVILHYFSSFFLPISLTADTDLSVLTSMNDSRFFIGTLFIVALLVTAVMTSGKQLLRPISFGIFWFLFTLLPTSLIPLAEVMNGHRVFLPYIGLTLSVSMSIHLLIVKYQGTHKYYGSLVTVVIVLFLSANAYGTYRRNEVWKTEESLWRDVTKKSPRNGRGLMNYGLTQMEKGDYINAEKYFLKSLALLPDYALLHINLGVLNEAQGNFVNAEQYYKKAISLQSNSAEAYFFYGRFLYNHRRFEEARDNLKKTIQVAHAHLDGYHLLIKVYSNLGDNENAISLARQILTISPFDETALALLKNSEHIIKDTNKVISPVTPEIFINASMEYYRAGRFSESIDAACKALQLRPGYDIAYNNICAAYNALQEWDKAITAGEQAVLLNPNNALAKNNLTWARNKKFLEKTP